MGVKSYTKSFTKVRSFRFYIREGRHAASVICTVPSLSNLRLSTGITIPAALWDAEAQRCKGKLPVSMRVNARLADLESRINEALLSTDPKAALLATLGKKDKDADKRLLFPFFYEWVVKGTATKLRYDRQNLYTYNLLRSVMPKRIAFDEVDYNMYLSILRKLRNKDLKENSIGQHIKTLKAVMNEAYRRGLHTNTAYLQFRKPAEEVDAVYLTAEELQKIKKLQLSGHLAKARDLFLLGCYTAMRYSDYSRITEDWIKGNNLVFTEEKTGNRNSIPLSKAAKTIIGRYHGAPALSQQRLNEYIKDVCKAAGLTDKVEINYVKGGVEHRDVRPKYELVSTHTARRTGATLLVKAGAPVAWVMKVTGHRSEKTFLNYIRLSSEEYADLVRKYVDTI